MQFVGRTILGNTLLVGGFNPSEKYDRQIGSFPQFSGWKKNKSETTTLITLPESLKLTFSHLQMDGWNTNRFPNWGSAYFQAILLLVSGGYVDWIPARRLMVI